ncbi:MAG: hypothetical protein ACFB0Z_06855 [Candidatus Phaeomarinobacter sp.]
MSFAAAIPALTQAAQQVQKAQQQSAPMQLLSRVDSNPNNAFGGFSAQFGDFNTAPLAGSGVGINSLVFLVAGGVLAWMILR